MKLSRGEWRIIFIRKPVPQIDGPCEDAALLIKRLEDRGVTPSVATVLVRDYPHELIEMQMEVLDRLQQAKERESIRNPAGYLVKSIREGYVPPANLLPKRTPRKTNQLPLRESPPQRDQVQKQIDAYIMSLSDDELSALEVSALAECDATLADGYRRSKENGTATFSVYRRMVVERGARNRLFLPTEASKAVA